MFKVNHIQFKNWECDVKVSVYATNGRLALMLVDSKDGQPVATATTNLHEQELNADQVFIKDWSENEGMLNTLIENGIVLPGVSPVPAGYVTAWKATLTNDMKMYISELPQDAMLDKVISQW